MLGPVTVTGSSAAVWLEGERRGVEVLAPGGYHWKPKLNQELLVLKTGAEGETLCAVGAVQEKDEELVDGKKKFPPLLSGEVALRVGDAELRVTRKGELQITGILRVNGEVVGPMPQPDEN